MALTPLIRRGYLAFFDVDGTLLNSRSLLSFLDYYRRSQGLDRQPWFLTYCSALKTLLMSRVPRAQLNAFYYTLFQGQREEILIEAGQRWFDEMVVKSDFFNMAVVEELRRHQACGAEIALVTGSFEPVMNPLALLLDCQTLLCTRLEVVDGRYSGALLGSPCIGEGKVEVVRALARRRGIALEECVAYGDDESDGAMLALVGKGHLVHSGPAYRDELSNWIGRPDDPSPEGVPS